MGKQLQLYLPEGLEGNEEVSQKDAENYFDWDDAQYENLEVKQDSHPHRIDESEPVLEIYNDEHLGGQDPVSSFFGLDEIADAEL